MKIKVLFLIKSLGSGGAERQLVELIKSIDKSKFEPHLIIYDELIHYQSIYAFKNLRFTIIEKKFKLSIPFYLSVVRYIKENNIDIIHSFMINTNFHGKVLKILSGKKLICSIRDSGYKWNWMLLELLSGWIPNLYLFNSFTAQSEFKKGIVGIYHNKFITLHNLINIEAIKERIHLNKHHIRAGLGITNKDYFILCPARICEQKNQLLLLKAIDTINTRNPIDNCKVVLLGDITSKHYYQEIKNFIIEHNMRDKVYYHAARSDIHQIYNSCDLVILTSVHEGFPNVIMEASAHNRPVISTNVSDVKYLIKNGKNGYILNSFDSEELAELIIKSKSHVFRQCRLLNRYDSRKLIKEYEKVYTRVI